MRLNCWITYRLRRRLFLGTSRGGLIAMGLAATVRGRLLGVCLNDIGPVVEAAGMADIMAYLGRPPIHKTYADMEAARRDAMPGFGPVPDGRWAEEVRIHYRQTQDGLHITYDPALRDAVLGGGAAADLWPLFAALDGLPLALLRGVGSNILSRITAEAMARRRPDMIWAEVADRGHVPFLDEPECQTAIGQWLEELP